MCIFGKFLKISIEPPFFKTKNFLISIKLQNLLEKKKIFFFNFLFAKNDNFFLMNIIKGKL